MQSVLLRWFQTHRDQAQCQIQTSFVLLDAVLSTRQFLVLKDQAWVLLGVEFFALLKAVGVGLLVEFPLLGLDVDLVLGLVKVVWAHVVVHYDF